MRIWGASSAIVMVLCLVGCAAAPASDEPAGSGEGEGATSRARPSSGSLEDRAPFRSESSVIGRGFHVPTGGGRDTSVGELALIPEASVFLQELEEQIIHLLSPDVGGEPERRF